MIIGDERFLMKHRIQRNGDNYEMKSVIKSKFWEDSSKQTTFHSEEILKDKLLMELIDNPAMLWKYLKVRVRNAWMEREMIRKQLYKGLKGLRKLDDTSFKNEAVKYLKSVKNKSKMLPDVVNFLLNTLDSLTQKPKKIIEKTYFAHLIKSAFRIWFFTKFCVEDEDDNLTKKKRNKNNRKNRKKRKRLKGLDDLG